MEEPRERHEELLDELPVGSAVVLRLAEAGYPDQVIATALGIPAHGVDSAVRLAQAKLSRLSCPSGHRLRG